LFQRYKEQRYTEQRYKEQIVETEMENLRDETLKNPEIIQDYNKLMQGVDREYQILHYYLCCRKNHEMR
jgi:hypothetical protein